MSTIFEYTIGTAHRILELHSAIALDAMIETVNAFGGQFTIHN